MADPNEPTASVTLPPGLRWVAEKLAELHKREFTGNVSIALKPGSSPIVKIEETIREEACRPKR